MNESDENKRAVYIRQLRDALVKGQESLSEIGQIELRRRTNTVGAILDVALPKFDEQRSLDERIRTAHGSKAIWAGVWFWVLLIAGWIVHEYFKDPGRSFQFTFGSFLIVCGLVVWAVHLWEINTLERTLKATESAIEEMLFRWSENSGQKDRFSELRKMVWKKAGQFGMDTNTDEYREWHLEMEADFLDNIHGSGNWVRPYPPHRW